MRIRCISSPASTGIPAANAYRFPVIRLFDPRDIEFLRSMPGYTPHMETEFRRRRCSIFHGYLSRLRAEFRAAWMESPKDHETFALAALCCRLRFAGAMVPAYLRLCQYRWELGTCGLGRVVQRFEGILAEIPPGIPVITALQH